MKKKKSILILFIIIVFTSISLPSCYKNKAIEHDELIGNWISMDLVDTINLTSDLYLYKMINGNNDRFTYSVYQDSIKIGYIGKLMPFIYIGPPKYQYFELNGNELTIDFKPQCYGFRQQVITFLRK